MNPVEHMECDPVDEQEDSERNDNEQDDSEQDDSEQDNSEQDDSDQGDSEQEDSDHDDSNQNVEQQGDTEDWRTWEKNPKNYGSRWHTLEHKGPAFPPDYELQSLPFFYDGKQVLLSLDAEEVAGLYARDLRVVRVTQTFNENFFKDWRSVMTIEERNLIKDFSKCNFSEMIPKYNDRPKKEENKKYGYCTVDGTKVSLSYYRIQSPDLVRSGKEYMKGKLKKRITPEDVTINCSLDKVPEAPAGHKWGKVIQKNKGKWLASWEDSLTQKRRYMRFHLDSAINGRDDYHKYETARQLHTKIEIIRETYKADWNKENMSVRQCAIALYIIDKLAIRVGIESGDNTVGCCSLRVEHITLTEPDKVKFNFIGKKYIEYTNDLTVEPRVFENLQKFIEDKKQEDKLFDKLDKNTWKTYLEDFMPGLTGKVFRTYHSSKLFEEKLIEFTKEGTSVEEKIGAYRKANLAVANLCNHKRSLKGQQLEEKPEKIPATTMAKEFYMDPRITAAWCIKHEIPIDTKGIFTKSQCKKFKWAIEMVKKNPNFKFLGFRN